jgi:hypothetical protein
MYKKLLTAAAISVFSMSAFAGADAGNIEKSYELKDGSTVHMFKDGKMGMEDKMGRAARMKEGHVMETKDGQKLMMKGDEVWRVEGKLHPGD